MVEGANLDVKLLEKINVVVVKQQPVPVDFDHRNVVPVARSTAAAKRK